MIAELGITIFLLCNSPVMLRAEGDYAVYDFRIIDWHEINGRLEYFLGDESNKDFVSQVEAEMQQRGIKYKFVNKQIALVCP